MAEPKHWTTFVQVRNNQLITYDLPDEGFSVPAWRKPPKRRGYSGEVTAGTQKRIRTAIDVMLQKNPHRIIYNPVTEKRQKFQLSFITLTISQSEPIEASEGHKALKVWLQHFKRPWHKRRMSETLTTYIWKAELQERGQLHYHLTAPAFLHHVEIRRIWNDIQRARGWLNEYHEKTGKWDANSTDVRSIYKIKDVGKYLGKYIAKQQYRQSPANPEAGHPALLVPIALDAKVWGCSEDLKGAKRFSAPMDKWTDISIKTAVMEGELRKTEVERCNFYDIRKEGATARRYLSTTNLSDYENWVKS